AMFMQYSLRKNKAANRYFVAKNIFPETLDVLQTRAHSYGIEIQVGDIEAIPVDDSLFGVLVQYPDSNGMVQDYREITTQLHERGLSICAVADLLSLTLLMPPGEWGADVVVGSSQRFGIPMGFGGPHAAYFATKEIHKRNIPGRIIGVTTDAIGNYALRMALQTREQHIRRDKASSNICTAQALLAIMAGFYAAYHGPHGLRNIAERIHALTTLLDNALQQLGYTQS